MSMSRLSTAFQWVTRHIFDSFTHLLDHRSIEAWVGHFEEFAAAVHRVGRQLTNIVVFFDGSKQKCDKPSVLQNILYNGHTHVHCLKWQGRMFSNGI